MTEPSSRIDRIFAASRFVDRQAESQPSRVAAWLAAPPWADGGVAAELGTALPAAADGEEAWMSALRRFRNQAMARIGARAIAKVASLDETLGDLSDLADACCQAALDRAGIFLHERFGAPREPGGGVAQPIVLGMGKLGGRELNFSSDIDLIFAFTENGDTDGGGDTERTVENAEYFARLAREVSRLLSTTTADGFVFRVDTLLRPFGSAGAAAISTDAMSQYYLLHGREWERYALIKARPCAGDLTAGTGLLRELRPFVYRRYFDYNALGSLRELKQLIDQDARRRGAADNLKLGPGGIRELEFIVQLFQLTRGGQDARLRDPRLRPTLRYLGEQGLLPVDTARRLDDCYAFLRRCENAIQMYADQQTHVLPAGEEERAALCAAMNVSDWATLIARLDEVRRFVRGEFERLFAAPAEEGDDSGRHLPPAVLWNADLADGETLLRQHGFAQRPGEVMRAVDELRTSRLARGLGERSLDRMQQVAARVLDEAATQPEPETAALRALKLIAAIVGRGTYVALLHDNAGARHQLVRLCALSPWVADLLAATPSLLDALLDGRLATEAPLRDALTDRLRQRAAGIAGDDVESLIELLRRYRQEMTLRIAAADLCGTLPLVQVSDRLTWLAEAIVALAVDSATALLRTQYGTPPPSRLASAGFAVIAYGKFGSIELGYGSDLDLVFVYDADSLDDMTVGGTRALTVAEYYTRLVQRIVHLLTVQTGSGRAYEIDLQLRPSGNSGLVVTRLAGFERYQRESAWIWEHQALLRARVVTGDVGLGTAIGQVRREVLMQVRDPQRLRGEVAQMRVKMRTNLEKRVPGRWDVKQGRGGLIDAEFLTQYLCLLHAHNHPSLIAYTDNWRQLEALEAAGLITAAQKDGLLSAERAYRGWLHRRSLQQEDALAEDGLFAAERDAVSAQWNHYFGE